MRLLDSKGSEVSLDAILEYPEMRNSGSVVRVTQRVYQECVYPGAIGRVTSLLYPAGTLISIFEAEQIKSEIETE